MSRKLIHLFTDETGSDDVEKETGLAMGTVLIEDSNIGPIYKAWKEVINKFSNIIGKEIKFLHAIDLTNGLKGIGKYKFLAKDNKLLKEINDFFEQEDFDIVVTIIDVGEYRKYMLENLYNHYQNPEIQIKFLNKIFSIVKIRHFAFTIPHVLEDKVSSNERLKIIHKIEQRFVDKKGNNFNSAIESLFVNRINSKFKNVEIKNTTVTKEDSVIGLQLADFVVNPIKRCYIDHECKRKDFKVIKSKILYVEVLDKKNLYKFLKFINPKIV